MSGSASLLMPLNFEIVIVLSYSCAGRTDLCTLDSELSDWLFDLNFRAKESTNQKQFYRSLDSMSKKKYFFRSNLSRFAVEE